jgi:hypothetical protein
MLYVRGNLKNVTIDLAIHSHSAPIFRLRFFIHVCYKLIFFKIICTIILSIKTLIMNIFKINSTC